MVTPRDGDEIDLLDASIRTTGGALASTTLYVLSGVVYVAVTSAEATGTYFFVTIGAALVLRPIRGVSQALRKIGTERGETVGPYLGVAVLFAAGYLAVAGLLTVAVADEVARLTVFRADSLPAMGLYALALAASMLVTSLIAAIGYPSAETWISGGQSAIQLAAVLGLAPVLSTAGDLLLVSGAVRLGLLVPVGLYLGVVPTLPDRHVLARVWQFGRWSVPDQVLDRLSYNMPVYVLGVVATPAAVGIYETADRFADFGATISWRLSAPLLARVSGDDSVGDDHLAYLDGAVTGGTGVTLLVLGYLLAAHDVVGALALSEARATFSTAVLLVGGVNVLRGFWTLTSHAVEGVGRPGVSFRTKLYGLAVGVPVTALLGSQLGAVAGALGYGVMNLAIFGYVVYYARRVFGRLPVHRTVGLHLCLGAVAAYVATEGAIVALEALALSPLVVAVGAVAAALVGFVAPLLVVSVPTRRIVRRTLDMCLPAVRSVLR